MKLMNKEVAYSFNAIWIEYDGEITNVEFHDHGLSENEIIELYRRYYSQEFLLNLDSNRFIQWSKPL